MASDESQDHDTMVSEFSQMSGASVETALRYLESNNWNMLDACNNFFQDEDDARREARKRRAGETSVEEYDGPRTLDGRPAPRGDFRAPRPEPKKTGLATLGSMGSSGPHVFDDDDDDDRSGDDDPDGRGDLFAGGEKSGLAVQDPRQQGGGAKKIINDIFAKARANAKQGESGPAAGVPPVSSRFHGTGMILGGDGVESRAIPDAAGPVTPTRAPLVERVLHIWNDGFSIDDGELRRFDDPANQMDLEMIRSGRAPLHLMNVDRDQGVDVKLHRHDSPYKALPKKYKPFSGSGQRLGSPVPGVPSAAPVAAAAVPAQPAASSSPSVPTPEVDSSQPLVTIRIQLPDGTRLPARFNASHTLGDVYAFIRNASPAARSRPWVLVTTFPNKEHTDQSLVLGDMSEFKKGGTAVVKWS